MLLNRAHELCQLPLDQSKSHIVHVDRFALIHVLEDRKKQLAELKETASRLREAEAQIENQRIKLRDLAIQLKKE